MPRPPHTPFLDAWRERLRAATSPRGSKAELARFLEARQSISNHSARNRVALVLGGDYIPSGETVLAINAWMDG